MRFTKEHWSAAITTSYANSWYLRFHRLIKMCLPTWAHSSENFYFIPMTISWTLRPWQLWLVHCFYEHRRATKQDWANERRINRRRRKLASCTIFWSTISVQLGNGCRGKGVFKIFEFLEFFIRFEARSCKFVKYCGYFWCRWLDSVISTETVLIVSSGLVIHFHFLSEALCDVKSPWNCEWCLLTVFHLFCGGTKTLQSKWKGKEKATLQTWKRLIERGVIFSCNVTLTRFEGRRIEENSLKMRC